VHIRPRAPAAVVVVLRATVVVGDGARRVVVVFAADVAVLGAGDETHCAGRGWVERWVVMGSSAGWLVVRSLSIFACDSRALVVACRQRPCWRGQYVPR